LLLITVLLITELPDRELGPHQRFTHLLLLFVGVLLITVGALSEQAKNKSWIKF
jgi:hypothetical protein